VLEVIVSQLAQELNAQGAAVTAAREARSSPMQPLRADHFSARVKRDHRRRPIPQRHHFAQLESSINVGQREERECVRKPSA
jgi:hypothetical protein